MTEANVNPLASGLSGGMASGLGGGLASGLGGGLASGLGGGLKLGAGANMKPEVSSTLNRFQSLFKKDLITLQKGGIPKFKRANFSR